MKIFKTRDVVGCLKDNVVLSKVVYSWKNYVWQL